MEALGGGSHHIWLWLNSAGFNSQRRRRSERQRRQRASSDSSSKSATNAAASHRFPLKQALTAGSLALAGDTIAQFRGGLRKPKDADRSLIDSDDPPKVFHLLISALTLTADKFRNSIRLRTQFVVILAVRIYLYQLVLKLC